MVTILEVEKRDPKAKKAGALRRDGKIPATIYGPGVEPHSVELGLKDFKKIPFEDYKHVIEITEEGKDPYDALIKKIQKQPVSGEVQNIEFYKLKKGHKVTIKLDIKFTGDSEAVKMGGDLILVHQEANIRCLPRQIPKCLEADLSKLKEIDDAITFGDLPLSEGVELLDPPAEVVCKAATKKVAVVETSAPAAEAEAAEGATPAEGEAPAAEGAAKEGDAPAAK